MTQTTSTTSLFKPAEITSAYLKMGIMGKQGSGKSKTAAKVAIGLVKLLRKKGIDYASKPVAFFDTETGSDWLIPDFEAAKVELVVAKKKSFADLLAAMRWAQDNASALIIDSITHPWRELLESYMKKKQRSFLQIDDWSYLKGDHGWAQFTDLYVNSKLHIIMCGRAGDDLEQYTDENGKRQLEKIGVKMKTEGETGFEPSLLVLMEREMNQRTNAVTHRAYVVKDRSERLDGDEFDNPNFENFLPHIELLNLGGGHVGVDSSGDSQHILKIEKRDWQPVQRRIAVDEIQTLLVLHIPGQAAADKKRKLELVRKHFDNKSWVEIEEVMALPDLRKGYDALHQELEGAPSRYALEVRAAAEPLNDSLPDHSAKPAEPQCNNNARTLLKVAELAAPKVEDGVPGGIPDFLRRPVPPKDRLLGEIAGLRTPDAALDWCLKVSASEDYEGLPREDKLAVHAALNLRQAKLRNGHAAA